MKIKHLYDASQYPDLLSTIALTAADIKDQISTYKLRFIKYKNQQAEWAIRFPMFVFSFYNYIAVYSRVPQQEEFYQFYLSNNHSFFACNPYSEDIMLGLQARVYRAYPSLVRDVHFNKYIQQLLTRYQVSYNIALDVDGGIDLMISTDNRHWGICLFTDTARGNEGRRIKNNRHCAFENVTYVELPIKLGTLSATGDFYLYGKEEYEELIKRMV